MEYIVQDFLILVPVLYVLGLFLKGTPKVPNWLIPWIIGVLGVALGFGIGGFNVNAAIQGILAAAAAVYGNQLWKQVVNGINEHKEDKK